MDFLFIGRIMFLTPRTGCTWINRPAVASRIFESGPTWWWGWDTRRANVKHDVLWTCKRHHSPSGMGTQLSCKIVRVTAWKDYSDNFEDDSMQVLRSGCCYCRGHELMVGRSHGAMAIAHLGTFACNHGHSTSTDGILMAYNKPKMETSSSNQLWGYESTNIRREAPLHTGIPGHFAAQFSRWEMDLRHRGRLGCLHLIPTAVQENLIQTSSNFHRSKCWSLFMFISRTILWVCRRDWYKIWYHLQWNFFAATTATFSPGPSRPGSPGVLRGWL